MADFRARVEAFVDTSNAINQINSFVNQNRQMKLEVNLQLNQASQALNNLLQQMQSQGGNAGAQFAGQFSNAVNNGTTQTINQIERQTNRMTINIRNSMRDMSRQQNAFNETTARTFDNQMTAWARSNSRAINAMMRDNTQTYGQAMQSLHTRLNTAIINQDAGAVRQIREEFRLLQSEARATGNVGKSFGESFTSALGSVTKFMASYVSIYRVFNTIKDGIKTVVELDDALVDLQKTSNATPKQLNSFYKEANNIAKQYGTTTRQIIQGAADWSRLGYNLSDAQTMSKLSSQFAAISPGMSVDESTDSLVSTMKAFGVTSDNVLDGIMSKVNKVGNSFALSNADVMVALKNSSSAMAAANNSFEETVALITAGTEITQDASKVGNGLRTISMRIRGMNEETEELDDGLVNIKGDVAELTNGKVSIMEDAETYKSTYQVLKEISHVWDELSDKNQAQLLDKLFGKTRAQIGAAIIQNFSQAESAIDKMATSAGAADAEMEIITNSLSYKLNALKETGTGIFQNIFQRDDMGVVIDGLTSVLGVIDSLTDSIGLVGTAVVGGGIVIGIRSILSAVRTLKDAGISRNIFNVLGNAFPMLGAKMEIAEASVANGTSTFMALGSALSGLLPVIIAVGAAIAGFKAFEYFNTGWTRAQESATKAVQSFQEAKTKLDTLNEEKDSNLSKVKEIATKYNIEVDGADTVEEVISRIESSDTTISLVDEAELSKLATANSNLENQIKIQERLAETKRKAMLVEVQNAETAEKSYWEHVRERHGEGFFGTLAAAGDWIWNLEGASWDEGGTTNLDLARKSIEDLNLLKVESSELDAELAKKSGELTEDDIKRRDELNARISKATTEASGYLEIVQEQAKVMLENGDNSDFAKNYIKSVNEFSKAFAQMDMTPAEKALDNLENFFDGTKGKSAIKDYLRSAAEEGRNLGDALSELGLSLSDLGIDDDSYLTSYFAELKNDINDAKQSADDFRSTVEDVENATKSENQDKDWTTIQSAYKSAKELLEEGKTGTDDFQTFAQFMSPNNLEKAAEEAKEAGGYAADVYQKAFEEAVSTADRWFGEDETESMMNFVDDFSNKGLFNVDKNDEMGLWDIKTNFETTAEAADKFGISVGAVETMLNSLEAYGYDFSGISKSGELLSEYKTTLDALKQTYDGMENSASKLKLGKLIEGFDSEYEGFQADLSSLTEEQVVHIKFEYDLANIQTEIDSIKSLIEGGDNSVSNNAQLIATQDSFITKATSGLGLDKEGVELPIKYQIARDSEVALKEQLKSVTSESEKIELQAKIENEQEIQKSILDNFSKIHPEINAETDVSKINDALGAFDYSVINVDTHLNSSQVEDYLNQDKDATIIFNANLDGVETQVTAVRNKDGTISYTAIINGEPTEVNLDKQGNITYEVSQTEEVSDEVLNKQGSITYNVATTGDTEVAQDQSATVNYEVISPDAPTYEGQTPPVNYRIYAPPAPIFPSQNPYVRYNLSAPPVPYYPDITRSITYYVSTVGSANVGSSLVNSAKRLSGRVDGTAHANGTAFANGNRSGDWGTKNGGVALGGELGEELLVRDGHFFTIGANSAEFFRYKRGDIIFNAEQTKEIFEKGKITHGSRRGEALASGTAFRLGSTRSSGGSGSSTTSGGGASRSGGGGGGSSVSGGSSGGGGSSSSSSSNPDWLDWIEIKIDRVERKISELKRNADNTYKLWESRNKSLSDEIGKVTEEISIQEQAYFRYMHQANSVGLDAGLAQKVREGAIDISQYSSDSDIRKKIDLYKQWYDAAINCKESIDDLNISLSELYEQQFDNIITKWDNALQEFQHSAERAENIIDRRISFASEYVDSNLSYDSSTQNIKDYRSLIDNAIEQRTQRNKELTELANKLQSGINNGTVEKGSESYYNFLGQIQDIENVIDGLNADIINYSNSISAEYENMFEVLSTDYENKIELAEHLSNEYNNFLELAQIKGYKTSEKYYQKLMDIELDNIKQASQSAKDLQSELVNAIGSGEIKLGSQAWYDMTARINETIEAEQKATIAVQEYANKIREIEWGKFDYLQEKIENIREESDFLIDLMSSSDLFDETGAFTDEGIATAGLHAMNYNIAMNQADRYAKEIIAINKEIANDPSNTDLIKRKEDLIKAQKDSIDASEKEKQAIKSLVSDGIKQEMSHIDDLIDRYNNAIQSQKDIYDYQKRIKNHTSEISSLQKQLSAYSNDISEEARVKLQKIRIELDEKKEELEETEYERMVSDTKKMLDSFSDEYEKALNERLDNIDVLIQSVIDASNNGSSEIADIITRKADSVGFTLSDEIKTVWNSNETILTTYGDKYLSKLTSINQVISTVRDAVVSLYGGADTQAEADIQSINAESIAKETSESASSENAESNKLGTKGQASDASTYSTAKLNFADKKNVQATETIESKYQAQLAKSNSQAQFTKYGDWAYVYDYNYYKSHYADLRQAFGDDEGKYFEHFKQFGMKEGRQANSLFDVRYYKNQYKDLQNAFGNNLAKYYEHFINFGVNEGRAPNSQFNFNTYKGRYQDLQNAFGGNKKKYYRHWLEFGQHENRKGYATGAKRVGETGYVWTQEGQRETYLRASDHAVLTRVGADDRIYNAMASENLWQAANDPGKFIARGVSELISDMYGHPVGGKVEQHFDNISFVMPNIKNYDELVTQMQQDKKFEKLIKAMTVGQLNGKSSDAKYHLKFG